MEHVRDREKTHTHTHSRRVGETERDPSEQWVGGAEHRAINIETTNESEDSGCRSWRSARRRSLHRIVPARGVIPRGQKNICNTAWWNIRNGLLLLLLLPQIYQLSLFDSETNPGPASHFTRRNCRVLCANIRKIMNNLFDISVLSPNYDPLLASET